MPRQPLIYYQRRDAEIVKLFCSGYSTKEISCAYDLSIYRVRQIIRWSGVRSRKPTRKSPNQIMLGLGLDADLVQLEIVRFTSGSV